MSYKGEVYIYAETVALYSEKYERFSFTYLYRDKLASYVETYFVSMKKGGLLSERNFNPLLEYIGIDALCPR